jgi:hypothetical protein
MTQKYSIKHDNTTLFIKKQANINSDSKIFLHYNYVSYNFLVIFLVIILVNVCKLNTVHTVLYMS